MGTATRQIGRWACGLAALAAFAAFGQSNENAGTALSLALEAQEYALAITTSASSNSDTSAAIENAQRAIGTARRALQLDNSIALGYAVLGLAYRQTWRWADAKQAFEQAYLLAPDDPGISFNYGWFSSFNGDHQRAIEIAQRATGINPMSANAHRDLGIAFAYAGNESAATAALRQCIAINPSIGVCHIYLGFMLTRQRDTSSAELELREAERLFGGTLSPAAASSLAHAYFRTGLNQDARRLFDSLTQMDAERVVGAGSWPLAYLAIGDSARAYQWLDRAVEKSERNEPDEGFFNLMIIKHNVQANPVLDQSRFQSLRDRIGADQRNDQ